MELDIFASFWGWLDTDRSLMAARLRAAGCAGVEARVPADADGRQALAAWLHAEGFHYIATVFTGADVLPPQDWPPARHLEHLRRVLDGLQALAPRLVNLLAGNDRWPLAQQVEFLGQAQSLARDAGANCVFETHRGSSLYSPWMTLDIARQLPDLEFTLDISHWVVVCERLLDTLQDEAALAPLWSRVRHVQARVGYAQGPQVPHPAAPEYRRELRWHQQVWSRIWDLQRGRGVTRVTLTPEFGPDGYLHHLPFTNAPIADLWSLNAWMAQESRRHFEAWSAQAGRVATQGIAS